eukprot:s2748_g8.t1
MSGSEDLNRTRRQSEEVCRRAKEWEKEAFRDMFDRLPTGFATPDEEPRLLLAVVGFDRSAVLCFGDSQLQSAASSRWPDTQFPSPLGRLGTDEVQDYVSSLSETLEQEGDSAYMMELLYTIRHVVETQFGEGAGRQLPRIVLLVQGLTRGTGMVKTHEPGKGQRCLAARLDGLSMDSRGWNGCSHLMSQAEIRCTVAEQPLHDINSRFAWCQSLASQGPELLRELQAMEKRQVREHRSRVGASLTKCLPGAVHHWFDAGFGWHKVRLSSAPARCCLVPGELLVLFLPSCGGAAGLQSYGAWVDWEVCVVEKGASLAAQLLAMLTAKLCTAAAVLHLFCAVFMIFTDPRSRWGFRNLEPPPPDPTHIAIGAIGINAKLQSKVIATREKLSAADRQVATGFAVLAYLAQEAAQAAQQPKLRSQSTPSSVPRLALLLLLWHGMLFFSYISPMAVFWTAELPTLGLQECLFVAIAITSISVSAFYLFLLLGWYACQRCLSRMRPSRSGSSAPSAVHPVNAEQALRHVTLHPSAPPL